jgi:hypothetical protein
MHRLEQKGYKVYRTAGSHGDYDVLAFKSPDSFCSIGSVELFQCKTKLSDKKSGEVVSELKDLGNGYSIRGQKITKYIRRKSNGKG